MCPKNMIGRGRQRRTTVQLDRVMQRKVKVDRYKLASSVKTEIESGLRIIISEQTVCCRLHEIRFQGSRCSKRTVHE